MRLADLLIGGLLFLVVPMCDAADAPVRVSSAVLRSAALRKSTPIYPPMAKRMGVKGDVRVDMVISAAGKVSDIKIVEGPAVLGNAVRQAVSQWKFRPVVVKGHPAEVVGELAFTFKPQ